MSWLDQLQPKDAHNARLEANVHPPDWHNPQPQTRYNLVVIGAGTAGLVTAAGAAGLGARVALVERDLMGGDCLNVGCVPSKGVISSARVAATVRDAAAFGVEVSGSVHVDFGKVMQRMRRLRAEISPNDSAARFQSLGVDVFLGQASFSGPDTVQVGDATLRFRKAVIASGGRASTPPIPGLDSVDYLTNENVFSLTELPRRLGVIGAGPIGCELAQSFARFGTEVQLFATQRGILPREDRDAADIVQRSLTRDTVRILPTARDLRVQQDADGIHLIAGGSAPHDIVVDKLLVAAGRAPNVEGLNLDRVGVAYNTTDGIEVNERLQTSNPRIYAAGDVCSRFKFTHAADFMARIVIQNALFLGRGKASRLMIPWCTYTSPEVAHVGLNEHGARDRKIKIDTYVQEFQEVDRAILEGETEGYVKVHTRRGTDQIVGATIVAKNAGDLISEITLAMKAGVGLKTIGSVIHPYPTQAEAIRKLGDQFNRTRLTPLVKKLFHRWLSLTR